MLMVMEMGEFANALDACEADLMDCIGTGFAAKKLQETEKATVYFQQLLSIAQHSEMKDQSSPRRNYF
jgi:hypothetical protein